MHPEGLVTFKLPPPDLAQLQTAHTSFSAAPLLPSALPRQNAHHVVADKHFTNKTHLPAAQQTKRTGTSMNERPTDPGAEAASAPSDLKSATPQHDPSRLGFTPISGDGPETTGKATATSETEATTLPAAQRVLKKASKAGEDAARQVQPWTEAEDCLLRTWAPYYETHAITWTYIAGRVQSRTSDQCKRRWETLRKRDTAAPIKLEPLLDVTDEMTRVATKKTILDAHEYDLLWEMGLEKYKNDTSWQYIVDNHPRTWPTGPAGPTNVCSKWSEILKKRYADMRDHGLVLTAVVNKDTGTLTQISPVPNLETFENCPQRLQHRVTHDSGLFGVAGAKRKAMDIGVTTQRPSVKRAKYSEPITGTKQIDGPIRFQASVSDSPHEMHTEYEQKWLPEQICDWCYQAGHDSLYKCKTCNALFCPKDLDSGQIKHHHVPLSAQGKAASPATLEIIKRLGISDSWQPTQAWKDAPPFSESDLAAREKRQRAAKLKALDSVHTAYQEHPEPEKKSSPDKVKKSSPDKMKLGSPGNVKKPKFRSPVSRTVRPEDDGSSSAFDEDEIRPPSAKAHANSRSPVKRPFSRQSIEKTAYSDSDSDTAMSETTKSKLLPRLVTRARRARPSGAFGTTRADFKNAKRHDSASITQIEGEDMHDGVADSNAVREKSIKTRGVSGRTKPGPFGKDSGHMSKSCDACRNRKVRCLHRVPLDLSEKHQPASALDALSLSQTSGSVPPASSATIQFPYASQLSPSASQTPTSLHHDESDSSSGDSDDEVSREIARLKKQAEEIQKRRQSNQALFEEELRQRRRRAQKKLDKLNKAREQVAAEQALEQKQQQEQELIRKAELDAYGNQKAIPQ